MMNNPGMSYPATSLRGIKESFVIIFPKLSPPNVLIGGPVRVSPEFPLKACGNDGLQLGNFRNAAIQRESTYRD